MPRYSTSGKGHNALSLLATGPATLEQIRDHVLERAAMNKHIGMESG
jgi:hypothetical protein